MSDNTYSSFLFFKTVPVFHVTVICLSALQFCSFLGPLNNHINSLLISHLELIALALISTTVAYFNSFQHLNEKTPSFAINNSFIL